MDCEEQFSRIEVQYERLKKIYIENNELSFCNRLTNSYAILELIDRTIKELKSKDMKVSNPEALDKFLGVVTMLNEKLEKCGSQDPEERCCKNMACGGLDCDKAYDVCTPRKTYSVLEKYRIEMFTAGNDKYYLINKISVFN
ncbi:hypothetical protein CUJ83_13240 [Methanocella sp. CWC-04]|uniref:Uncharacterized protein n=1 Tax=Methanooceanicella nereidis TaxID=2052831 RepID=A0AAP2W8E4_9EURY|nr:hypothetical protein [Methanocella sp. CWC-04]MCD1295961.1 hypothetical protein [Methanocella sp. CWC-04]